MKKTLNFNFFPMVRISIGDIDPKRSINVLLSFWNCEELNKNISTLIK